MRWQEYLQELRRLSKGSSQREVLEQVSAVEKTLKAYGERKLPRHPLPKLGFSEEFIMDHLLDCTNLLELDSRLNDLRQTVIENFGIWHIFSEDWLDDLALHFNGRKTLQLMSGNAVLSAGLANVTATDSFDWSKQDVTRPDPWTKVENLDATSAVEKYADVMDVIIMEWAPDTSEDDWEVLQKLRTMRWPGEFIVIGERNGATNSEKFWDECRLEEPEDLNQRHERFDFIDDRVYLIG